MILPKRKIIVFHHFYFSKVLYFSDDFVSFLSWFADKN